MKQRSMEMSKLMQIMFSSMGGSDGPGPMPMPMPE